MSRQAHFYDGDVLREIITPDNGSEDFVARTAQDLEPVIELASEMRDLHHVVGHRKSSMTPIAEIPLIIYEQAVREGWHDDPKAWKKWLNDPQNKVFRITDGRA